MTSELTLLVLHARVWLDMRVAAYLQRRAAIIQARNRRAARGDVRPFDSVTMPISSGAPRRLVLVLI